MKQKIIVIFLAQEDVVGTRLLQHHELFSVGQSLSLQIVFDAPFYVEVRITPSCKMT